MFEKAKWILRQRDLQEKPAPLFRKKFLVEKPIRSASLNICGLGYGVYYINGEKVTEDVLTTPYTKYDSTVLYNTYDISSLINAGENVIGIIVGNGFYNDICETWSFSKATWRHVPKVILQLDIVFEDGGTQTIVSNEDFRTADSPITFNHARCGEIYDARLEKNGWNTLEYDDSCWDNALITHGPGGILLSADIPPIRIVESIPAKKIGGNIYDLGKNISGWVKIRVKGKEGTQIDIKYSERVNSDYTIDTHNMNIFNKSGMAHCDRYILRGGEIEEWEPNFVYHGFRYIQVDNEPENFEVVGRVVHTDLKTIGEFECSDEMLNKIHRASRLSTLTNFHGIPTDCPHREQNGWTGDAHLSAEQALMNFDMIRSYKKWMNDFKDAQKTSGQLPGIVPSPSWGYMTYNGPAWDSAIIHIPYYIYQIAGDISVAKDMWENMELYMEYLQSESDEYLITGYNNLGDWLPPKDAKICGVDITDTAYYYADARIMGKLAKILGKDSEKYETLAENIRNAFRKRFIKDGIVEGDGQTSIACGIYMGLYNENEIPSAVNRLVELIKEKDFHIDCGMLGTKYIFTALSENGFAEVAYKMVTNPTMPSYAYWINQGMTTLCESWDMENSLNHHMFSEVDMWFYRYIAGIRITEEGLTIKPCFIDGIEWVKARHKDIYVEWNREKITIQVPCCAKLILNDKVHNLKNGTYEFCISASN